MILLGPLSRAGITITLEYKAGLAIAARYDAPIPFFNLPVEATGMKEAKCD